MLIEVCASVLNTIGRKPPVMDGFFGSKPSSTQQGIHGLALVRSEYLGGDQVR